MGKKTELKMLTEAQLNELPTPRLLNVLKSARAVFSAETSRVNAINEEYGPNTLEAKTQMKKAGDAGVYYGLVKSICDSREDV